MASEKRTCYISIGICLSMVTNLFEIVSELTSSILYFEYGYNIFGVFTLFFLVFSTVPIVYIIYVWCCDIKAQITLIPRTEYCRLFKTIFFPEWNDTLNKCFLLFVGSCCMSLFNLLIQLCIALELKDGWKMPTVVAACASLLSLNWGVALYVISMLNALEDAKISLALTFTVVATIFTIARVLTWLSLFSYGLAFLLCDILFHQIVCLWFYWCLFTECAEQRFKVSRQALEYNSVLGPVFFFHNKTRSNEHCPWQLLIISKIYACMVFLEIISVLILRFTLKGSLTSQEFDVLVQTVIGLSIVGGIIICISFICIGTRYLWFRWFRVWFCVSDSSTDQQTQQNSTEENTSNAMENGSINEAVNGTTDSGINITNK